MQKIRGGRGVLLLDLLLLPILAAAQGTPAGTIYGYILDPDHRRVPGVRMTIGDPNRTAKEQGFKGKVLIVTAGLTVAAASDLIRSGVSGVFRKHDSATLLAEGIREVMVGKVWLDQEQLQATLKAEAVTSSQPCSTPFTERERKVLAGVFEGRANKEIAARLGVSESSVKASLQQLFAKTGVRTRSQLVRIVLEHYRDEI